MLASSIEHRQPILLHVGLLKSIIDLCWPDGLFAPWMTNKHRIELIASVIGFLLAGYLCLQALTGLAPVPPLPR